MVDESVRVRLKAFVGRSFSSADDKLWFEIRRILESLRSIGFTFEDAQEAQARPISEKVRRGIARNDFYIGILSCRMLIEESSAEESVFKRLAKALRARTQECQWTSSEWVVQESGFALGLDKPVILMIERGVAFPTADLDADTEWIPFDRNALADCSLRLVQMISNLIAGRLPTPATPLVTAPVAQDPTTRVRGEEPGQPIDELSQVLTLLNEKRFPQADELFESYLAKGQVKNPERLGYLYLKKKCLKGDSFSLEKLKATLLSEPGNVYARQALADCYESFKAYDQAAKILLDGAEIVVLGSRARILQQAAENLANDGQHDRALKILSDLLQRLPDPEERYSVFLTLAEVARLKVDQVLETAALEQALELNPSDTEVRFRVAYLYGEMKKERLAVYHYRIRISQDQDPAAINNLGAAFEALKLKGKEIEMYEAACPRNELAKANLSHAYVDRGFLKSAEELALQVERSTADNNTRERATAALRNIAQVRREEEETEKAILAAVKTERALRARYAAAFVALGGKPVVGVFNTPYGQLSFEQGADRIVGQGSFREEVPPSAFAALFMNVVMRDVVDSVEYSW